jgi:sugar (pentulose or hexulose) kinase
VVDLRGDARAAGRATKAVQAAAPVVVAGKDALAGALPLPARATDQGIVVRARTLVDRAGL